MEEKYKPKHHTINTYVETILEGLTFEDKSILSRVQEINEEKVLKVYQEKIQDIIAKVGSLVTESEDSSNKKKIISNSKMRSNYVVQNIHQLMA